MQNEAKPVQIQKPRAIPGMAAHRGGYCGTACRFCKNEIRLGMPKGELGRIGR